MTTTTTTLLALTREPSTALSRCELTYLERREIDAARALRQHRDYCDALRACGARVVTLPAVEDLPDSVFVEDTAIILDEVAVITRPGVESRRAETRLIEPEVARFRPVVRVSAPATVEGGDVLRVGRKLFVGLSPRTNRAGIDALGELTTAHGYEVVPVELSDCLHLKTACEWLGGDTILANPAWVDLRPFAGLKILNVPEEEPFASNVLRLGGAALCVNAAFPQTAEMLGRLGFDVRAVDISEFSKAEAGLSCMSLIFENAPE